MDIRPITALDRIPRDVVFTLGLVLRASRPSQRVPELLRTALFTAIREKLPRAATRVVRGLRIHVPRILDETTPPATFTSELRLDEPLPNNVVPDLSRFSDPNTSPILISEHDASKLFRGPACATTITPFVKDHLPALHAHVAVYQNAVLIGLTAVHAAFDSEGLATVLRAWAAASRGELNDIRSGPIDFFPVNTSALVAQAAAEGQPDPWMNQRDLVLHYLWELLTAGKQQSVVIRFPKRWVQEQKDLANEYLLKDNSQADPTQRLSSSSNDIITDKSYIHNATLYYAAPPIPANVLATDPLGKIAARLRRAVLDFRNGPVLAELAYSCKHRDDGKLFVPGQPGVGWTYQSSWLQARLGAITFALETTMTTAAAVTVVVNVRPDYVSGYMYDRAVNLGLVVFEDDEAYWATWYSNKNAIARNAAILKERYGLRTAL
ncbi:hypothetical protein BKA62DRAFT_757667 [Auriculariales sp. MPI-PUGE-AT-0066]|nr:hypothetical protein BKA62DRAFT_757667 [Auriculariales sp. MPI-PUGE-AT-0066]